MKTKFPVGRFLNFVESNPGYDFYVINPFWQEFAFFKNEWAQGERHHPGLLEFTKKAFEAKGLPANFEYLAPYENFSFCNY